MTSELIRKTLMSFKGLSDCQANALIEIIKQQKSLNKTEIVKLLNKTHICEGNACYKIIDALVDKSVVFKKDSKYEAINTSMLIADCNNALTMLEAEIGGLEITQDWEKSDPRKRATTIDEEFKIINELYKLKKTNFTLEFFAIDDDKNMPFWNNINAHFKRKPLKGVYNCIIFQSAEKPQDSGLIILSKRLTKEGKSVFYGNLINDEKMINMFRGKRGAK